LQKQLDADCDPVPCPKCGWYQEDMIKKIRRDHRVWIYWVGVGAIFAMVICGAFAYMMLESDQPRWVGWSFVVGVGLSLLTAFTGATRSQSFDDELASEPVAARGTVGRRQGSSLAAEGV